MCGPIVSLIAGVASGIGGAMSAGAAAASASANAKLQQRQAEIEQRTGAYKADRQQEQIDRISGQQRAAYASSGLSLQSGAPANIISDSAEEGALDIAAIRWNSNLNVGNTRYQARISKMNAKSANASIPLAFAAPVINSVGSNIATYGGVFG